jgi:hypothetical protein
MTEAGPRSSNAVVNNYNLYSVICRLSSDGRHAGCSRAETIASHR